MIQRSEICVVICTRNRRESLAGTLDSLAQVSCTRPWEVLVIDNASSDDTSDFVRTRATSFAMPLRLVCEPRIGLSMARNRALRETEAEVVIFLDDDVVCDPRLVEAHAREFDDPDVHATGGRIIPLFAESTPLWFQTEALSGCGGPTARYDFGDARREVGVDVHALPVGANFGLRRERAIAHGGFDERLGWGLSRIPGEETKLLDRFESEPGRIFYVPDALVHHRIGLDRTSLRYFREWYEGLGRFEILRYRKPVGIEWIRALGRGLYALAKWRVRYTIEREPNRRLIAYRRLARARGRVLELVSTRA
jgi:glycosyltransferase involved in cell wall biosynthesis